MNKKLKKILTACCSIGCFVSALLGVCGAGLSITKGKKDARAMEIDDRAYYTKNSQSIVGYEKHPFCDVSGINAQLVLNDSLVIKNVVDLNESFAKDEAFIKMMPITKTIGLAEYTQITLEMIDVYDENNFVKVQINAYPSLENSSMSSYYSACASNGQKLTGVDELGNIYVNNMYGPYIPLSFSGLLNANDIAGVYYDCETKTIYSEDYLGARKFVVDLDSPTYFGTKLWDGFTSNEVYCKISIGNNKVEKPSILVTKYGDYDLSNDKIYDVKAPKLNVEYGDYEKATVPQAIVDKPYSVFSVSAFDAVDGITASQTKVYMNYYSSQKQEVRLVDQAFTPRLAIPHYIVYTSQDSRGNIAEEVVKVEVITKSEPLDICLGDIPNTLCKGEELILPEYAVQGGVGEIKLTIKVTLNGQQIQVTDGRVRPFSTGNLQIVYYLRDYVGQSYSTSRSVVITPADKPTFIEEPILPKYLITGNTYHFPKLNAYNYVTAEGEIIPTTLTVVEGNQTIAVVGEYVPGNVSFVEVVYTAKVGTAENSYRKTLPVYQVSGQNGLDMSKYFLCEDGTATIRTDSVVLSGGEGAKFSFLNQVSALSFHTEFMLGSTPTQLGKIHILLVDAVDESKSVRFTYEMQGRKSVFYINDDRNSAMEVLGDITPQKMYELTMDVVAQEVNFDIQSGKVLSLKNYLNGQRFSGFTNGCVYVSYSFENVQGNAEIGIIDINWHKFNDEKEDWIEPTIEFDGNIGGEYDLGDIIRLPKIVAMDVLSGSLKAYVTVKTPSGKVAVSTTGENLSNILYDGREISLALNEYGNYSVSVEATDDNGNTANVIASIWVVDRVAPILKLSADIVDTVTVGTNVLIPKATAEDNLSENLTVKVYVVLVDGKMMSVNQDGFYANEVGVYTVVYYVADEAGNCTVKYYSIQIKEAK